MGKQYVGEATDLTGIPDGQFEFVAASHVLEHTANPLRALQEWKRVLEPDGMLLVVLPDKRASFDHKRPFTSFAHIESDFQSGTGEDDLTHLDEVSSLHDLGMDPRAGSQDRFRQRCEQNLSFRAMHHHVFSPEVSALMFSFLHLRILNISIERPYHIIGVAQKVDPGEHEPVRLHNLKVRANAEWANRDPFRRWGPASASGSADFSGRSAV
jgi:SAM-dependent methyltransferase